jgi:pimeloyl-ACP methyl ester carboxylesterase
MNQVASLKVSGEWRGDWIDMAKRLPRVIKNYPAGGLAARKAQATALGEQQTLRVALQASLKGTIDCETASTETDFQPDMKKANVPTLVIHGADDQVVPFEATGKLAAEMISGAKLKVYPGAPHATAVTHRYQVNWDRLEFLQT